MAIIQELELLGKEFLEFQFPTPQELIKEPSRNYYLLDNKMHIFIKKVSMLFNKQLVNSLEDVRKSEMQFYKMKQEAYQLEEKIKKASNTAQLKEELDTLSQKLVQSVLSRYKNWDKVFGDVLKNIEEDKIC